MLNHYWSENQNIINIILFSGARADVVNFLTCPYEGMTRSKKVRNNFSHTFVYDDECLQTNHKRMGGNKKGSLGSATLNIITGF